jgi:hypothetical protein
MPSPAFADAHTLTQIEGLAGRAREWLASAAAPGPQPCGASARGGAGSSLPSASSAHSSLAHSSLPSTSSAHQRPSGGCPVAAATALLYRCGEGLVRAEHAVRSTGRVRFWQPGSLQTYLALCALHGDLLDAASLAASAAAVPGAQAGAPGAASSGGSLPPLVAAVAGLLLRPEGLDLLGGALELATFSGEFAAAAARAGRCGGAPGCWLRVEASGCWRVEGRVYVLQCGQRLARC